MAEQLVKQEDASEAPDAQQEFVPRGAVAFFAAMLALFAAVWLALYWLMLHRH
jgi:hypothetical protein